MSAGDIAGWVLLGIFAGVFAGLGGFLINDTFKLVHPGYKKQPNGLLMYHGCLWQEQRDSIEIEGIKPMGYGNVIWLSRNTFAFPRPVMWEVKVSGLKLKRVDDERYLAREVIPPSRLRKIKDDYQFQQEQIEASRRRQLDRASREARQKWIEETERALVLASMPVPEWEDEV